jgi:hypothetical protein
VQLGVFIPIGNNGWLISTTSPQYLPSFDLTGSARYLFPSHFREQPHLSTRQYARIVQ